MSQVIAIPRLKDVIVQINAVDERKLLQILEESNAIGPGRFSFSSITRTPSDIEYIASDICERFSLRGVKIDRILTPNDGGLYLAYKISQMLDVSFGWFKEDHFDKLEPTYRVAIINAVVATGDRCRLAIEKIAEKGSFITRIINFALLDENLKFGINPERVLNVLVLRGIHQYDPPDNISGLIVPR